MINISIIIPNFNGAKYLPECLKHIQLAIKNCPNAKFETIIVDNGSTDDSVNYSTIQLGTNTGFATAVNRGINTAKYEYVCLLNNDVNLDKNWFIEIFKNIKLHPKTACFCGTIFNKEGTEIESQGIAFNWSGKCLQLKHNQSYLKPSFSNLESIPVWGSSAAAVIYQKTIIRKLGLFDEKYFAYIEDVDLSFRLQQNGYQTLLVPKALAYHLGGGTTNSLGNFRARQVFKNWIYFIFKNYSPGEILKYLPQIIIERLRNFSYLVKSSIKL